MEVVISFAECNQRYEVGIPGSNAFSEGGIAPVVSKRICTLNKTRGEVSSGMARSAYKENKS